MSITLHIPDSIINAIRLPEGDIETRLNEELAAALYGQGLILFGKASEVAGMGGERLELRKMIDEEIASHPVVE